MEIVENFFFKYLENCKTNVKSDFTNYFIAKK